MCGIIGATSTSLFEFKNKFESIVDLLHHRGPDDKGSVLLDDVVFLGHTRLSVIDLSIAGRQPMSNEDGSLWIVYNGEIYNFQELRDTLRKRGYKFRSQTDTEVILHLYADKKEECVKDLNGMFAFAIYDKKKQQIFIARDRMGIKPLYYSVYNSHFVFASEIKAILATNIVPKEINWQSIYDYFSFLYVPCPQTAFRGIEQIPPAHYLTYNLKEKKIKLAPYWNPCSSLSGNSISLKTYEELKHDLSSLLEEAVKLQLVSDVPLGVFLSGGIDSSILSALAAKNSTQKLKTFTVIFEGKDIEPYDERQYAQLVSKSIGSEHTEVVVQISKPDEVLDLVSCFDQPFANPTFYLNYLISKVTKKSVTVVLSGAGGDELFGGYPRYKVLQFAKVLNLAPKFLSKSCSRIAELIPESNFSQMPRRMKLFLRGIGESLPEQYLRWTYYFSDEEKNHLLQPLLTRNGLFRKSTSIIDSYLSKFTRGDLLNKIQYVDLNTFLLDNVLEYTDKTSMAFGLEVRVPYLDHRLVELGLNIPQNLKIRGKDSKFILKDTFKNLLPSEIFKAPKRGFCAPISIWIDKYFDFYFDDFLTQNYIKNQGIMNWDYIQMLRKHHKLKMRDNSMELFGIIMFDVWYRKYFG